MGFSKQLKNNNPLYLFLFYMINTKQRQRHRTPRL